MVTLSPAERDALWRSCRKLAFKLAADFYRRNMGRLQHVGLDMEDAQAAADVALWQASLPQAGYNPEVAGFACFGGLAVKWALQRLLKGKSPLNHAVGFVGDNEAGGVDSDLFLDSAAVDPADEAGRREGIALVHVALNELRESHRKVLLGRACGLTLRQMATDGDISFQRVEQLSRAALPKFAAALSRRMREAAAAG